jgi:anti-sigma B factor antagonist
MLKAVQTLPSGVTVASIEGRMTLGTNLMFLEGDLKKLVEAGSRRLVLDLGGVLTIDSAGLGVLIGTAALLRKANGEIRIANVQPKVQEIFDIVRVHQVLPICPTVNAAVDSFSLN